MKNFGFDTIFATYLRTTRTIEKTRNCAWGFISKSALIEYHQLMSKVTSISGKSRFDQLAIDSFSTPPYSRDGNAKTHPTDRTVIARRHVVILLVDL